MGTSKWAQSTPGEAFTLAPHFAHSIVVLVIGTPLEVDESDDGKLAVVAVDFGAVPGAYDVDAVERDDVQLAITDRAMAHEMRREEVRIGPRLSYCDAAFVSCRECI